MNPIIIRTDVSKRKESRKRGKGIKAISMMFMLMVVTGGVLLILSHELLTHQKVLSTTNMASHSMVLICWRYILYGLIVACWPMGIRYLGKQKQWSREHIEYLSKQRILVCSFFVIVELLFVYNLLSHIIRLF